MKFQATALIALLLAVSIFVCDVDAKRKGNKMRRRKNRKDRVRNKSKACPAIPTIENGHGLASENKVAYACQPGYRLEGTNVITCINGRWTVAPTCVREICPAPPNAAYAKPPQLQNNGLTAVYNCLPGYKVIGGNGVTSKTIHCDPHTRSWPSVPQCEAVVVPTGCPAPPVVLYAMSQVSGKTATYTCNQGYKLRAGTPSTIHCIGHRWSYHVLPVCDVDSTTKPSGLCPPPPCGTALLTRPAAADSYKVGSKITYTCVSGYRITGSNDNTKNTVAISCKSDGTWDKLSTCEKIVCGTPETGTNTSPVVITTPLRFGDTYTYACITNYQTGMPLTTTCQADGKFSNPAPTCTPKVCAYSALPTLVNGAPFGITANSDTAVGGNVTFACIDQYRVAPGSPGSTTQTQQIQCQSNGTFTSLAQTCVYRYPSSCKDYFTRDNIATTTTTSVSVMIDTDGATTTNSPVTVTCATPSSTTYSTSVSPSAGATVTSATSTSQTLTGVTFAAAAAGTQDVFVLGTSTVTYPLSSTQLSDLISNSNNCQQVITSTCTAAQALALYVKRNGQNNGLGYSTETAVTGTVATAITSGLESSACDCYITSTTCPATGCICSGTAAVTGTDTITSVLSSTRPQYVTDLAIVGLEAAAADQTVTVTTTANVYSATVGNIVCVES